MTVREGAIIMTKKTGILMPIFSLPSNQGIGDFGRNAYRFMDMICEQGVNIWQILPLNPIAYGNSPYQPYSSFAGEPLYISIDTLADYGLLKQSSIRNFNKFSNRVDYEGVRAFKEPYFKKAYKTFIKEFSRFSSEYQAFLEKAFWLNAYCAFITIKQKNHFEPWYNWPIQDKEALFKRNGVLRDLESEISYEMFLQFMFYKQWGELRDYAKEKGLEIMGDIPFYVGGDSADVWANQDQFLLDQEGHPTFVAGVPPDYFSQDGQRWGNPIYDWEKMKADGYRFWVDRLAWNQSQYDIIRIDHFRAFDTYWQIPAWCPTAKEGEWVLGPAYYFFDTILAKLPDINLVAEDLGDLRPEVITLKDHYNLMGMNVLQFEMAPKLLKRERGEHVIVYTGTHDNDTMEGAYQEIENNRKIALRRFFHNCGYRERNFYELVVQYALSTNAKLVIIPIQDLLGLKSQARINTPGTIGSPNWEWKLKNLKAVSEVLPKFGTWMKNSGRK